MRSKQTAPPDPLLQFGMIERQDEVRTDSDELEKGSRRRKKHKIEHQNQDDEEEARKKARGRPRVDTKDETAADVSFMPFQSISYLPSHKFRSISILNLGKFRPPKKQFFIFCPLAREILSIY
jgi:hypothetical protein